MNLHYVEKHKYDIKKLIKASQHWNKDVHEAAINYLAQINSCQVIVPLIDVLTHKSMLKDSTYKNVIETLVKMKCKEAIPAMKLYISNNSLKWYVIDSLLQLKDSETLNNLNTYIENGDLCIDAIILIGKYKCKQFTDQLIYIVMNESNDTFISYNYWLNAVDALGSIGDSRGFDAILSRYIDCFVRRSEFIKYNNSTVEKHVYNSLSKCETKKKLIDILLDPPPIDDVCLETKKSIVVQVLLDMGWKPQTDQEKIAFHFARNEWIELAKVGPNAFNFIKNERREYNEAMVEAMGIVRNPSAIDELINILLSRYFVNNLSDLCKRRAAVKSLAKHGDEAIQRLVNLIIEDKIPYENMGFIYENPEIVENLYKFGDNGITIMINVFKRAIDNENLYKIISKSMIMAGTRILPALNEVMNSDCNNSIKIKAQSLSEYIKRKYEVE